MDVSYARPRFHRLFRPSRLAPTRSVASRRTQRIPLPPHEHDDDVVSPFQPSHVHELCPYVCTSRCSRPRPYVHTWLYFLSCTLAIVRTCTCYMHASTMTRARLYYYTCPSLHGHGSSLQPADRSIVCTYTYATRMTTLHIFRPGGS